jgi:hypothetical protein
MSRIAAAAELRFVNSACGRRSAIRLRLAEMGIG